MSHILRRSCAVEYANSTKKRGEWSTQSDTITGLGMN